SDTNTTTLWLFDETEYENTTITDASPYEMTDLTLMNRGSYIGSFAAGKWGNCLSVPGGSGWAVSYSEFKGSVCNDEMRQPNGTPSGVWGPTESPAALMYGLDDGVCTVEFWINLPSLPGSDVPVLHIGFAYDPGWTLDLKSNGTVLKAVCPTSLSTGQWVHVAFTQNGTSFSHYVDGQEQSSPTVSSITEEALPALQIPAQRDHEHRDFGTKTDEQRRQARFNMSVGHNRQGTAAMNAKFDEVCISNVVRYTSSFTAPGSFSRAYGDNPLEPSVPTGPPLLFDSGPSTPVQLGSRKYMFIDDVIVDTMSNATITCNPPTDAQAISYSPAFAHERPSVFDVNGVLYMMDPNSYGDHTGEAKLLTSDDGINFDTPNCETWGNNNLVFYGNPGYGEAWTDTNPNISSEEKYKFTQAPTNRGIYLFVSPDGINWRRNEVAMLPIFVESGAETFYDDQTGTYYNVLKRDSSSNWGDCTGSGRRGVTFETDEVFKTWPFNIMDDPFFGGWTMPLVSCEGPVTFAPNANGEIYRTRAIKYPWAPDVYLTFIWRYPASECRQVDLGVSRDGVNWAYFANQTWYMGKGSYGEVIAMYGFVRRDSIHYHNMTAKDEMWQYFDFGGCHGGEPRTWKRYIQRLDGFVSLDAGGTTATVVTLPLVFDGNDLALNVKATGTVKVALLNQSQQELPGYGLADCDAITADRIEQVVTWNGDSDVSSLKGSTVRVKFEMTNAKLYAMQFIPSVPPEDVTAPTPDPMTWAVEPNATGPFSISMTASTATDTSGVQYYFECTAGGGHDSGWQNSPTYDDTGLTPNTEYTYKVQARDKSPNLNVTAWSSAASVTTLGGASETETFDTASSAESHGWQEYNSRTSGSDFGFSNTNYAGGGSAGEGGGTFKRTSSANAGYYADANLGGTPDLDDTIFARGKLIMANSTADQHWWLGHLGTSGFDGSSRNLVGFRFMESGSSEVRVQTVVFLSNGTARTTGLTAVTFTAGGIASFDYVYDPNGNGGLGRLVANLRDSAESLVYTGTLDLSAGDKTTGAVLDGFGAAEGALGSDGADYIDMYFDDVLYSTVAAADTDPPTPNPATFDSAPAAVSSTEITMTATTGSDASPPVEYFFDETSGNPGGSDSTWTTDPVYNDTGLDPDTQYTYTVQMRDSLANTGTASAPESATTLPAGGPVDDVADSDIAVAGTVSGSYLDTQSSDDVSESIQERESGGKPANRHSYLEHKWSIDVTGGSSVTFYVEAYHTANSENDDFTFAYSTTGVDGTYNNMLTVTKTADNDANQSFELPGDTSGVVHIRVADTDQSQGNRTLDTVYIDHMFIRSVIGPPPPGVTITESNGSTDVAEEGPTSDTYTVVLDTLPSDTVTITVDPDVETEVNSNGAGNPIDLTFLTTNWDTAQTVTVTAIDDGDTEGDHTSTITHSAVSSDPNYNGISIDNVVANVTDNDCTASTMHVESIVCDTVAGTQGKKYGRATVTIYDNCGYPVTDALVDGTFTGDYNETFYDVPTNGSGVAVFVTTTQVKKPSFMFCVDDVTDTLTYDSNDNVEDCDTN
ncbi:MAG: LamG-like jellyroll fold domain-containing protein, partial [Planctomycetota bacterium]